jgi:hypothetical protein
VRVRRCGKQEEGGSVREPVRWLLSRASEEREVRLEKAEREGEPWMRLWLRLKEEREEEEKIEAAEREKEMLLKERSSEDREDRSDNVLGNPP